jgi:hypothetical protein
MRANTFDAKNSTQGDVRPAGVCCDWSGLQVAQRSNSLSPIQWLAGTWFSRDHRSSTAEAKG